MLAIAKHEFWQLFKSFKSIVVIIILIGSSYYASKHGADIIRLFNDGVEDKGIYYSGFALVLILFGPLFAFSLSHDVLNREVSNKTIRFLLTRTSHANILVGKVIGVLSFWFVCLMLSCAVIVMYAKYVDFYIVLQMMMLMLFSVSLTFLLSAVISKPFMSMFLSTVFGIALPIVGLLLMSTKKWWGIFGYITPYQYMEYENLQILIMIAVGAAIIAMTYIVFKRRAY